jgi:hypothetical protein
VYWDCDDVGRQNFLSKSYEQHGNTKYLVLYEDLAAITGIHGVSSSLWLPINQSKSGNCEELEGVIADTSR